MQRFAPKTIPTEGQKQAKVIKKIQEVTLPNLRQQLAETTGIFKGKERKALEKQIQQTEVELAEKLDKIPDILKDDGYPDVQAFMKTYRKAEAIATQYNQDLAKWEQAVKNGQKPAEKQYRPPKNKVCVTGSDSFRKRVNRTLSRSRERTPKTGTNHDIGNRHRRATCLAVLHISEHKKTPCKILRLAGCFRIFLYCNSIYWSHSYASFGPPSKVIRPQYSNPSRTRICCITLFSS